jgi:outer membrane protein OmpA-like peptidoglycan-associated protein
MRHIKQRIAITGLLLAVAGLAGCGSLSHDIARDGGSAGQLVWPTADSVTPLHKGGTSPEVSRLQQIHAGMNKQQVMGLVGPPHFHEGVWGVREWNYLFHIRQPGSDAETVCQYKILFDRDRLARSFYWMPESCAALVHPQAEVADEAPMETFSLSTDTLFAFDTSDLAAIQADGRRQLDELAGKIAAQGDHVAVIHVLGHTDRLGSEAYNNALSQKRAYAVMRYLVAHDVPGDRISVVGLGESRPVKTGCTQTSHEALVACLAPNRRVEVLVYGRH